MSPRDGVASSKPGEAGWRRLAHDFCDQLMAATDVSTEEFDALFSRLDRAGHWEGRTSVAR